MLLKEQIVDSSGILGCASFFFLVVLILERKIEETPAI
jgi:hypothetical protein